MYYGNEIDDMYAWQIEKRMQDRHEEIMQQFQSFFGQDLASELAACVGLALHEETKEGKKIAEFMGLNQADVYVINDNYKDYEREICRQYDDAKATYQLEDLYT